MSPAPSSISTDEGPEPSLPTSDSSPRFEVAEEGTPRGSEGEATPEEDLFEKPQPSNRKYLFKLGIANGAPPPAADTVYKPREERPRQHCTLIIFDWDDTLLCTSALQSAKPPSNQELLALEREAVKVT